MSIFQNSLSALKIYIVKFRDPLIKVNTFTVSFSFSFYSLFVLSLSLSLELLKHGGLIKKIFHIHQPVTREIYIQINLHNCVESVKIERILSLYSLESIKILEMCGSQAFPVDTHVREHDRYDRLHHHEVNGKTDVHQAITRKRFAHEMRNESNAEREFLIDVRKISTVLLRQIAAAYLIREVQHISGPTGGRLYQLLKTMGFRRQITGTAVKLPTFMSSRHSA